MAKSSPRHRIHDALNGMLNCCKWFKTHAQNIANLAGVDHPEIVDWAKAIFDMADTMADTITDMKGKI